MPRRLTVAGCCMTLAVVLGCGPRGPAAPGESPLATLTGTWVGRVTDSYAGAGRLRLSIQQQQFGLTGTFLFDFDDPARNRSGTLSGNTEQPSLPPRMLLSSSGGFDCAPGASVSSFLQAAWSQVGDTMNGTYVGFGCVGTVTGAFEVNRD